MITVPDDAAISKSLPPWTMEPGTRWITVSQFAQEWRKHRNTIRIWCENGFLCTIGIATYRDHRGRWYIRIA